MAVSLWEVWSTRVPWERLIKAQGGRRYPRGDVHLTQRQAHQFTNKLRVWGFTTYHTTYIHTWWWDLQQILHQTALHKEHLRHAPLKTDRQQLIYVLLLKCSAWNCVKNNNHKRKKKTLPPLIPMIVPLSPTGTVKLSLTLTTLSNRRYCASGSGTTPCCCSSGYTQTQAFKYMFT